MRITLTIIRIILFYVAFTLIFIGSLSVLQHWSHGRPILGAGLLLAVIMLLEAKNRQKALRIIAQLLLVVTAGSTLVLGTLFCIQHWQGATVMLCAGILLASISLFDKLVTKRIF